MLTITDSALQATKRLTRHAHALGARVSTSAHSLYGSGRAVWLEPASEPDVSDRVFDAGGAHVFLAPRAAALCDEVPDAGISADELRFELRQQD
jgi:Fe-S cluster assembly iron-binding protein IscA